MLTTMFDGLSIEGTHHGNHDRWGIFENYAWVIDRATGSEESSHSVTSFVNVLNASMSDAIRYSNKPHTDPSLSLIVQKALDVTASVIPDNMSSATLCVIRINPNNMTDYFILGDCALADKVAGHIITDQRLNSIARHQRALYKEALLLEALDIEQYHKDLLTEESRWRNVSGGFWVAQQGATIYDKGLNGTLPHTDVLIGSDGLLDVMTESQLLTINSFKHITATITQKILANNSPRDDLTLVMPKQ